MEYQEVTPGAPRPGEHRELNVVRGDVAPARIYLQPIASPWTLGLMSLGAISFVLGAHWAGWYGRPGTPTLLFPFILLIGGLVQLLAGMWSFRARDVIGAVTLTTWGGLFLGFGVLNYLFAVGIFPTNSFPELGIVFFVASAITLAATAAAAGENLALMVTLLVLTIASALLGVGSQLQSTGWMIAGGWVLFAGSLLAYYTASALMLESSLNRRVLPVYEFRPSIREGAVDTGMGEPGVVRHTHPAMHRPEQEPEHPSGPATAQA